MRSFRRFCSLVSAQVGFEKILDQRKLVKALLSSLFRCSGTLRGRVLSLQLEQLEDRLAPSTTYTFTPAGATGQFGPTQAAVDTAYTGTNLAGAVSVSGGIQDWVVPFTDTYTITAAGAQGASATSTYVGGAGALVSGDFYLTAGTILQIAVGQMGVGQGSGSNGGGGGGSFVVDASNNPLLIAGGGGGTRAGAEQNGTAGQISEYGTTASGYSLTYTPALKTTGLGQGGIVSSVSWGSAGAGFSSNGASDSPYGTGGASWANGLVGGDWGATAGGQEAFGGFGGGGAGNGFWGGGGGGGYSGGDGGLVAGGGGSYNAGANQSGTSGYESGNGFVTITLDQASQAINFTAPTSPITFVPNETVNLSATGGASGNPVVFSIDASSTGSGIINGTILTVSGAGNIVIDANQAGNSNYSAAAQVQQTLVVNQAMPTVTVTDAGGTYNGSAFPATATVAGVSGSPGSTLEGTGLTLTYYNGTYTTIGQLSGLTGTASAPSSAGSYTVLASYAGSKDYSAAAGLANFSIGQARTTISVPSSSSSSSDFAQDVTFTATVSAVDPAAGTPTGTVTFLAGTKPLGQGTLHAGVATYQTSTLAIGSHTITAVYSGDTNFDPSSTSPPLNQTVTDTVEGTTIVTGASLTVDSDTPQPKDSIPVGPTTTANGTTVPAFTVSLSNVTGPTTVDVSVYDTTPAVVPDSVTAGNNAVKSIEYFRRHPRWDRHPGPVPGSRRSPNEVRLGGPAAAKHVVLAALLFCSQRE